MKISGIIFSVIGQVILVELMGIDTSKIWLFVIGLALSQFGVCIYFEQLRKE
jgi:hypothetical protein